MAPRFLAGLALALASAPACAEPARRSAWPPCPADAPEGVRLPPRAGCPEGRDAPARADGFREIGGVALRIGGRVGADYAVRR